MTRRKKPRDPRIQRLCYAIMAHAAYGEKPSWMRKKATVRETGRVFGQ